MPRLHWTKFHWTKFDWTKFDSRRIWLSRGRAIAGCAAIAAIILVGCGGKTQREGTRQAAGPDTAARGAAPGAGQERPPSSGETPDTGGVASRPGGVPPGPGGLPETEVPPEVPASAMAYGYDRAGEYVRNLQERAEKVSKRLDDIERRIRATEAPQTPEMDARLETLRAIGEDIDSRAVDAENSATEGNWRAWQASLEKEMGNLDHGTARLDSMVTAVRRSP